MRSMYDKHQAVEEPCEGNLSSTVLQTSRVGDCPAEFNSNAPAGPDRDRHYQKSMKEQMREPQGIH